MFISVITKNEFLQVLVDHDTIIVLISGYSKTKHCKY